MARRCGTQLSEEQQRLLSKWEVGNFFSLVLQGERPLVQGLVHRLYSKKSPERSPNTCTTSSTKRTSTW